MVTPTGCDICNKSSLSLLLLRPSPVVKIPFAGAPEAPGVAADAASIHGLVPKITQSRYVLRLLRAGYVHVYIPNPPAGVKSWLVYRVTDEGDLIPEGHALFKQTGTPMTCSRTGHIATGMKIISIPQAHKIPEIWLAFSANLWNARLRNENAGKPAVMQKVSLQSGGPNTFVPTAERLKAQVLECNLTPKQIEAYAKSDFPYTSLAAGAGKIAANLAAAAAKHPKTAGKELAVVLRDHVAIAAELNDLRLLRNMHLETALADSKKVYELNSANAILGLKQTFVEEAELQSYEQVSPIRTKAQFDRAVWQEGAQWVALTPDERKMFKDRAAQKEPGAYLPLGPNAATYDRPDVGRVRFQHHERVLAQWTKEKVAKRWSKFERYYDEKARDAFIKDFDEGITKNHRKPLGLLEEDWWAARNFAHASGYFDRHFDEHERYDLRQPSNPGVIFGQEDKRISQPQPHIDGPIMDQFTRCLDPTDPRSIAVRKLAGNHPDLIGLVHAQLTANPGDGMRDKSYDFVKGLSELEGVRKHISNTYPAAGIVFINALATFSIGQLSALSAAVATIAARTTTVSSKIASMNANLLKFAIVLRGKECVIKGALKGTAPAIPILLKMEVDANEALAITSARAGATAGISRKRIRRFGRAGEKILLTVLTDTDAIKAAGGSLMDVARNPSAGTVNMGSRATLNAAANAGTAHVLTDSIVLRLYGEQSTLASSAANRIHAALSTFENTRRPRLTELANSLDARLAAGSMMVQFIGFYLASEKYRNEKDAAERSTLQLNMADSVFGFAAGALSLWATSVELTILRTASEEAVKKSVKIAALRTAGALTGIAGGAINYVSSMRSYDKQIAEKNIPTANLYAVSALMFAGTGVTSFLSGLGAIATTAQAKSIGGNFVRGMAVRLTAGAVVSGIAVSVSGIGLVLLGIGIATQIAAVALTPDKFQRWLARTAFGLDGAIINRERRKDRFKSWEEELAELDLLIKGDEQK
jgi:hypothetical protein